MAQYGVWQYGTGQYGLGGEHATALQQGTSPALAHQFNVASTTATGQQIIVDVPGRVDPITGERTGSTVWNQFDEHGLLVSLRRITGETNAEYRRRLQDSLANMANSAYRGLIHGVTRELGLSLFYPLLINPKVNSSGDFLAPDPYILFDGARLYLYSDYANDRLDWAIDRFEPGGNYEHLGRLVEFVNTTAFFEAHLVGDTDPYTRSMTIVNQSHRISVDSESAKESTRFKLEHDRVVPGSVTFDDQYTFKNRKATSSLVQRAGDYHINYRHGIVTVGSIPNEGNTINYQYTEYPFKPVASPVILHDINNDSFKIKMFHQITLEDGTQAHGLPTEVGADIINEVLSVVPMYWGV